MAKILIVDDEEVIRMLYAEELEEEDEEYRVITAGSGWGLIEIIESEKPDLVILDIKMAEHDGLDLLQDIKKHDCNLPVILLSAYSSFRGDIKSAAADYYVVKSADVSELKENVRRCIACRKHKDDADRIKDLVEKKQGSITESDYRSLYLQATNIATTADKRDIKTILDHEIAQRYRLESHNVTLRKVYRYMAFKGDISLKAIPDGNTLLQIYQKYGGPWFPEGRYHDKESLVESLKNEHHEISKEIATLKTELHSILMAMEAGKLGRIINYEGLKDALTFKEKDHSPLLLGNDFKIILDDFYHDLKAAVRTINDFIDDAEDEVDRSLKCGSRTELEETLVAIRQRTRDIGQSVKEMEEVPLIRSLTLESVNLKARISDVITNLGIGNGIKWEVRTHPSELSLITDAHLFSIILKNVIKNAMEAMPRGGRLTVRAEEAKEKGEINVEVTDNGVGISAELVPKVFDLKFSRGKEKGRGMGLYIAKKAALALGGNISIRSSGYSSTASKGTTVHIELPKEG